MRVAAAVVASQQRGPRVESNLLVVFSADRGIILTGYQVAEIGVVAFPEDAQWLKEHRKRSDPSSTTICLPHR